MTTGSNCGLPFKVVTERVSLNFEAGICMRHDLLVGCRSVVILSIALANQYDLYPIFLSCWGDYMHAYLLFISTLLVCSYYGGLFLRGSSEHSQRVFNLAILEFSLLTAPQFSWNDTEGATESYYIGSIRFDYVVDNMIFWLLKLLVNILITLGFTGLPRGCTWTTFFSLWHFVAGLNWLALVFDLLRRKEKYLQS